MQQKLSQRNTGLYVGTFLLLSICIRQSAYGYMLININDL